MTVQHPGSKLAYGQETAKWILDTITEEPERHDQSTWIGLDECGTSRCVGGWAAFLHPDVFQGNHDMEVGAFTATGMAALCLSYEEATVLFYDTDNAEAIRALEFLAKGEVIDWRAVYDDEVWGSTLNTTHSATRAIHAAREVTA